MQGIFVSEFSCSLFCDQVKVLALKLAELMEFLRNREAESDQLQCEIQDTFKELNKLENNIMAIHTCNNIHLPAPCGSNNCLPLSWVYNMTSIVSKN